MDETLQLRRSECWIELTSSCMSDSARLLLLLLLLLDNPEETE